MHAYSQDLRDRVLRALERGDRPTAIARRFEVSRMWVHRVRERWQKGGFRRSLPMGGHRRSRLAGLEPLVRDWIEQAPDLTLAETCGRLAERGVTIRVPALCVLSARLRNWLNGMKLVSIRVLEGDEGWVVAPGWE